MITDQQTQELRKDFPLLRTKMNDKKLVYLDNAATTQKPKQVIQAIKEFYEKDNANIHRGIYTLSEQATQRYEDAKKTVAGFINARPDEIICTRSTTESLNLLAFTLPELFTGKDERTEIVLTEMEHHANLVPWQQVAKRKGWTLKFIRMKEDFTLDYEDAKKKISEKTAIVSVGHVSNALGTINDVETICRIAHEKGALFIVDAAQSAPHMPIDAKKIGCDFLAFSGHKMCGPTGIGVLFGRKELLEKMPPFNTGGDMIRKVTYENAEWNDVPMKFEAGTPNIAGAIGLAAAIEYLKKIGMENIEAHEKELLKYTLEKIKKVENITIYNAGIENSSGILSFNFKNIHAHDVAAVLSDEGICIRGGHHCAMPLMNKLGIAGTARASFYLYNTTKDIDRFINALKKIQKLFR
ncbi:MAG: cysteine desulfurase [Candidatus Woesearchaeota archaeon]|nr:cysteine desulfurase [Candidatus Woesearchaeota archaeon]